MKIVTKKVWESVKIKVDEDGLSKEIWVELVTGAKKIRISLGLSTETTVTSLQHSGMNYYDNSQVLDQKEFPPLPHRKMKGRERKRQRPTSQKSSDGDFPGGTVDKNPPANAGDTGSSPGPGRFHMPRSN